MDVLGRVWDLSDIDQDGMLDKDEFAVVSKVLCLHMTLLRDIGRRYFIESLCR